VGSGPNNAFWIRDGLTGIVDTLANGIAFIDNALVKAGADAGSLGDRVTALEAELQRPTPDPTKLRGLLADVRNTISGAAGNIIASGVLYKLGGLLGG
jgi:hypothetical protein